MHLSSAPTALARRPAAASLCDHLLDIHQPPPGSDPARLRQVSASAQALLRALLPLAQRLATAFRRDAIDADELCQHALLRLVRAGPLRARHDAPSDDAGAARYLQRVLRNLAIDAHRRRGRDPLWQSVSIGPGDGDRPPIDPAAPDPTAEERLSDDDVDAAVATAIAAADARLDSVVAALCAERERARRGSGQALAATLLALQRAADGKLDVGELAAAELDAARPATLSVEDAALSLHRARNAIDARFKRARQALAEAVDAELRADPTRADGAGGELLRLRLQRRTALQGQGPASDEAPAGRRPSRPGDAPHGAQDGR